MWNITLFRADAGCALRRFIGDAQHSCELTSDLSREIMGISAIPQSPLVKHWQDTLGRSDRLVAICMLFHKDRPYCSVSCERPWRIQTALPCQQCDWASICEHCAVVSVQSRPGNPFSAFWSCHPWRNSPALIAFTREPPFRPKCLTEQLTFEF